MRVRSYAWLWIWLAAACSNEGAQVTLALTAPAPGQTFTTDADANHDRPGVQFDVAGTSAGIAHGTTIELFIDDAKQAVSTKVEEDGAIHIPDVTLPPGTHRIHLETSTGSEVSDETQSFTLKALVISAPDNQAELTEDEDAKQAGFQTSVEVTAYALALDDAITLQVDKKPAATATADESGVAVFRDVTLLSGKHILQAIAGRGGDRLESREVKVDVVQKCSVTFIRPEPPADGADLTLGGRSACPASGETPFSTKLELSTDVGDGRNAKLTVNGQPVAMAKVRGSIVTFDDVVLDKQTSANTIKVELETSNADSCVADYPSKIFVDCDGADCSITSPLPYAYLGPDDTQTLFLNRSMLRGAGDFVLEVATDNALAGHPVELIVDGNSLEPLSNVAVAGERAATAAFAVELDERKHTFQAQCTDLAGNVTRSSKFSWVVDVTACSVDITDPAANSGFVPEDDQDVASDGIQVVASASVDGDDCDARRAAVCDPEHGIGDAPFLSYDGASPLLSPITLDADATAQTLCVEVQDHAGNSGLDHVAVSLRSMPPKLLIESPEDGAKYNAKGGAGYTKDADGASATCEASFSVACTELGVPVELHHDTASGAVFASVPCEQRASGDPALPAGYNGRATLLAAFEDADSSALIVATQKITASSSKTLVGASPALAISGDCSKPVLQFGDDPCAAAGTGELDLAQAQARDVSVIDATSDIDSATLTFSNTDGTTGTSDALSVAPSAATWTGLDLGAQGTVTITAVVSDDFDNTAQISCMAQVVGS